MHSFTPVGTETDYSWNESYHCAVQGRLNLQAIVAAVKYSHNRPTLFHPQGEWNFARVTLEQPRRKSMFKMISFVARSLRHWRRYSGPCFLRFHSPSARNFMPVESTMSNILRKAAHRYFYGRWLQYQYAFVFYTVWSMNITDSRGCSAAKFNQTLHKASDHR